MAYDETEVTIVRGELENEHPARVERQLAMAQQTRFSSGSIRPIASASSATSPRRSRRERWFAYEERIVRPDGSVRQLQTAGEADRDEEGHVVGLIGACRDVT